MNAVLSGQRKGRLALFGLAAEGYRLGVWESRLLRWRDFLLSIEARFDGWCDG